MNKKLLFLQSCVRREVNTDDLGYLTKWLFQIGIEEEDIRYFEKIHEMIEIKFFSQTNRIKDILSRYI
jgi:hypothetical protein